MARSLVLAALVSSLAPLLACKGSSAPQSDIPAYPGSSLAGGAPNQESPAGTLFHSRRKTPDGLNTVAGFYRTELGAGRGWREVASVGPAFADGNLNVDRPGSIGTASPVDPARAGGFVVVYEVDNATYVEAWQWLPAAK